MRCRIALLGLPFLLTLAGCAQAGSGPASGGSPDHRWRDFDQRATEVAEAWRPGSEWLKGYVPLQDPTVLVGDPGFNPDTEQAFRAGWYRDQIALPTSRPVDGRVLFPDGTLSVPLISAADAYRQLDQGDPPPCDPRPKEPGPTSYPGPDGSVATTAPSACIPLTVTAAKLGTAPVRTSRGVAEVPAWLFTVEELAAPVARLAVAPSAVAAVPQGVAPTRPAGDGIVAAQDLTAVEGAQLTYRLGVGACDTGITALVWERDDVVVVGGGVTRATGLCTEQLVLEPVTVTLRAPLGARPVLDVVTGSPLTLVGP